MEQVLDVAEEVRLPDAHEPLSRPEAQTRLALRRLELRGRDVTVDEHRVQHFVPPAERSPGIAERVVARRGLRQAGEDRRLLEGQLGRRPGKIRLGGRLDPVGVVAVEDLVHVRVEDPGLRPLPRELDREAGLGELPLQRLLAGQVQVPDELLGDRRAALHDLARAHVRDDGARDADRIDAAVLVEAPVLDRDGGLRNPGAHLRPRHRGAVALGGNDTELRAVRRVDERVLADGHGAQRVEVAARAEDGRRADRQRENGDDRQAQQHAEQEQAPRALLLRPGPPLAPPAVDGVRLRRGPAFPVRRRRRHPQTPSARRRRCVRTRRSRSRRCAASSSAAPARIVTVAAAPSSALT